MGAVPWWCAILSSDGTGGRTGRAGGQHCDGSDPNRLLSGHACPVGAADGGRDAEPTALTSGTRPVVIGVRPGSRPHYRRVATALGRRISWQAASRWSPGSDPARDRATTSMAAIARVDRSEPRHEAAGITGQAHTATATGIIAAGISRARRPYRAPRINCGTEPFRGDIGLPGPATHPGPRAWDPLLGRGSCRPSSPAYADWSGGCGGGP